MILKVTDFAFLKDSIGQGRNKLIKGGSYSALPNFSGSFSVILIWMLKKIHGIQYIETKALRRDNTHLRPHYMNPIRSFNNILLLLDNGRIYSTNDIIAELVLKL